MSCLWRQDLNPDHVILKPQLVYTRGGLTQLSLVTSPPGWGP